MQLMIAAIVAYGWYAFFTGAISGNWWVLVLIGGTLVAVWRLRRYFIATQAAHNVVAAAATFSSLSAEQRQSVEQKALEVMKRSGWMRDRPPALEDDAERYGVYALALAELGISPVCLIKGWNRVRNPFREALNPPYYLATSLQLAARQGHQVLLNRPPHRS